MSAGNTDEVKVKIVTEADRDGVRQAESDYKKLKDVAVESSRDMSSGFGDVSTALKNIANQFRALTGIINGVLTGFGSLVIIQRIAGWVKSMREEAAQAKKSVEDLNQAVADINKEERIQATAAEYEKLAKSIEKANKQREVGNALEDVRVSTGREREDAQSRLEEAQALAAISPDDPLANEKKSEIKAQFASARGRVAVSRKMEDNTRAINRMQQERDALTEAAGLDNLKAEDLAKQAAAMRRDAYRTANQNKQTSVKYHYWGNEWTSVDTGDPSKQKADAEAAASMRQKAAELQKKAEEARAASEEKARKRAELLEQIASKIDRRVGLNIEARAVAVEGSTGRREAAGSTEQKRQAVIAEREAQQRAEQVAALELSKKSLQARQAAELAQAQQRAANAGYNYSLAQGRYSERTGALRFRAEQGQYRGNVDADPSVQALNSGVVQAQGALVVATRDLANLATSHKAQLDSIQRQIDKLNANQHNSKMGSGE